MNDTSSPSVRFGSRWLMMTLSNRVSSRTAFSFLALVPILTLPVLLLFFPPDGGERAPWAQFLGHFHPLVVHLPLALVFLVPVMELVGRDQRYSYLHASVSFVLALALITGIVAVILGFCLARSGGFSGPLVTQHMWGGVLLLMLCWTCWVSRGRGRLEFIYTIALVAAVGAASWTGYRGGQISLGENQLTEFMPRALRKLLGVTAAAVDPAIGGPATFYGARIQPIFAGNCLTCHSSEKRKGGLRLDSYTGLMRGGKDGPVVKAGDLRGSDLFRRITLPPSDDNFMPKKGRTPLSPDQVRLIELWIANGASGTASLDSIKGAPVSSESTVRAEVTFDKIDLAEVAKRRAEVASTLAELQHRFPNILDYESRGSADIVVNASLMGDRFKDDDVAALAPLSKHIIMADFSRTAVTDRSAPVIGGMKRLRVLRLMHTRIGDRTVQSLANLDQLQSLNIFDTAVTVASSPTVARLTNLKHFYAGQTAISAGASIPDRLKEKLVR